MECFSSFTGEVHVLCFLMLFCAVNVLSFYFSLLFSKFCHIEREALFFVGICQLDYMVHALQTCTFKKNMNRTVEFVRFNVNDLNGPVKRKRV